MFKLLATFAVAASLSAAYDTSSQQQSSWSNYQNNPQSGWENSPAQSNPQMQYVPKQSGPDTRVNFERDNNYNAPNDNTNFNNNNWNNNAPNLNQQNPRFANSDAALANANSDTSIQDQIQNRVKAAYKQYNLNIRVSGGIVTLAGTVGSQQDKDAIEKEVNNVPGVKKILNQITVNK